MTTLETRIYSHPPLPLADISPLEMLILTNVLECSETEEGLVLFTDVGPTNPIRVRRGEPGRRVWRLSAKRRGSGQRLHRRPYPRPSAGRGQHGRRRCDDRHRSKPLPVAVCGAGHRRAITGSARGRRDPVDEPPLAPSGQFWRRRFADHREGRPSRHKRRYSRPVQTSGQGHPSCHIGGSFLSGQQCSGR